MDKKNFEENANTSRGESSGPLEEEKEEEEADRRGQRQFK